MTILELTSKLLKFPKEEIEFALLCAMIEDKLDFHSLSNAYVSMLNEQSKDRLNMSVEAETCVAECLINRMHSKKKVSEDEKKTIQRCLYLLNQSKRFQMKGLNEHFGYDEERAKELSWYERNKDIKY